MSVKECKERERERERMLKEKKRERVTLNLCVYACVCLFLGGQTKELSVRITIADFFGARKTRRYSSVVIIIAKENSRRKP